MKSTLFYNTTLDPDRFFTKRLAVGLSMTSRNTMKDNIITKDVIDSKKLNLIDRFVILNPASAVPNLSKKIDVDQSVLDGLRIELAQTSPPYMLMKTTALFGGMDVESVQFDPTVPMTISAPVWNLKDADSFTPSSSCNINNARASSTSSSPPNVDTRNIKTEEPYNDKQFGGFSNTDVIMGTNTFTPRNIKTEPYNNTQFDGSADMGVMTVDTNQYTTGPEPTVGLESESTNSDDKTNDMKQMIKLKEEAKMYRERLTEKGLTTSLAKNEEMLAKYETNTKGALIKTKKPIDDTE